MWTRVTTLWTLSPSAHRPGSAPQNFFTYWTSWYLTATFSSTLVAQHYCIGIRDLLEEGGRVPWMGLLSNKCQPFPPASCTSGTVCTTQVKGHSGDVVCPWKRKAQPDILKKCEVQCGVGYGAKLPDLPYPARTLWDQSHIGKSGSLNQ